MSSSIVISFGRLLSKSNSDTLVRSTIGENHTRHIIDSTWHTHTRGETFIISLAASVPTKIKAHDENGGSCESRDRRRSYCYTRLPSSLFGRLLVGTRFLLCYRQLSRYITTRIRHASYVTPKIVSRYFANAFVLLDEYVKHGTVYRSIWTRSFSATGHVTREAAADWLTVGVTKSRAIRNLCAIYNTNHVKNIRASIEDYCTSSIFVTNSIRLLSITKAWKLVNNGGDQSSNTE